MSFYASLVNINAYHQPGVEAGKKAAGIFLTLLGKVRGELRATPQAAGAIAATLAADPEDVYHCLSHLAANGVALTEIGATAAEDTFWLAGLA